MAMARTKLWLSVSGASIWKKPGDHFGEQQNPMCWSMREPDPDTSENDQSISPKCLLINYRFDWLPTESLISPYFFDIFKVQAGHGEVKSFSKSGGGFSLVIKTTCSPFGLELAPCGKKVAGRLQGQFPHATLHDELALATILRHYPNLSSIPRSNHTFNPADVYHRVNHFYSSGSGPA